MVDWSRVTKGTIATSALSDLLMAGGTYISAKSLVSGEPYAIIGYSGIMMGAVLKYIAFSGVRLGRGESAAGYNKTI